MVNKKSVTTSKTVMNFSSGEVNSVLVIENNKVIEIQIDIPSSGKGSTIISLRLSEYTANDLADVMEAITKEFPSEVAAA